MTAAKRLDALERRFPAPPAPTPATDWRPLIARLTPAECDELDQLVVRCGPMRRRPNGHLDLAHVNDDDLDRLAFYAERLESIRREQGETA